MTGQADDDKATRRRPTATPYPAWSGPEAAFLSAQRAIFSPQAWPIVRGPPPSIFCRVTTMPSRFAKSCGGWWLGLLLVSPLAAQQVPQPPTVVPEAKLQSVYSDPRFFEGPVWDPASKKLYFTAFGKEKSDTQILRLDAPGQVTVWADKTEGVNGMALANDGRLLGAQAFGHRVLSYQIGPTGPADTKVLVFNPKWNQPNDVAQAPNGDIYFTDPDFENKQTSGVYLLLADGTVRRIITDLQVPNGLKVSNDGRTLYVADDGPMNWRSYPILPDGTVGPGSLFFDPPVAADKRQPPDGFTIDERGTLYLSGSGGVWAVDRLGGLQGMIPVPEFCSNVAFGGEDGKTLYLTCDKQVYSLAMKVRGGQFTRTNKPRTAPAVPAASAPPKPATPAPAAKPVAAQPTLKENVVYGTVGGEQLTLHLAQPQGAGPFPGVLFIHGGGWSGGKKDDHKNEALEAAKRGYVAVTVGYRLAPKSKFPAQVEDVKCAVRWMRAHAAELKLNPKKLGAVGFSAGAHLAMMLGTMEKEDGLDEAGGWAEQSSKVQAVVEFAGPTDLLAEIPEVSKGILKNFLGGTAEELKDAYRRASPITYVTAGDAPMLLYQGTEDPLVPWQQAQLMAQAMAKAKVPGRVELLLGAGHGWGGTDLQDSVRGMWEFLERNLK